MFSIENTQLVRQNSCISNPNHEKLYKYIMVLLITVDILKVKKNNVVCCYQIPIYTVFIPICSNYPSSWWRIRWYVLYVTYYTFMKYGWFCLGEKKFLKINITRTWLQSTLHDKVWFSKDMDNAGFFLVRFTLDCKHVNIYGIQNAKVNLAWVTPIYKHSYNIIKNIDPPACPKWST